MNEKTPKTIEDLSSELFDLEEPIHKARQFAEALRMVGSSDQMRGEPGAAIEILAQSIILILQDLQEKREFLCGVAIEIKSRGSSNG
jgi:hypothetical protein